MTAPKNNNPKDEEPKQGPRKSFTAFLNWWLEVLTGCLMLVGLVLAFFYSHIGGMLVGLAFGICFFDQIRNFFYSAKRSYALLGLFKTLMWIGALLYALITIPLFVIFSLIGFGIMFLIRKAQHH